MPIVTALVVVQVVLFTWKPFMLPEAVMFVLGHGDVPLLYWAWRSTRR